MFEGGAARGCAGRFVAVAGSLAVAFSGMCGSAMAASESPLQVSYPGDGMMSCDQLLAEVSRMEDIMGVSADAASRAAGAGRAAEVGTSVAINGALYSGALGAVPGLGMFANGAGMFAKRSAAAKQKAQEERRRTAESRRAVVSGLYQGKNCAAAPAVAEAAPPPATATSGAN